MHANHKTSLATVLLISLGSATAWAQTTPDAGALQKQIEQSLSQLGRLSAAQLKP